jgi:hypothetical protein
MAIKKNNIDNENFNKPKSELLKEANAYLDENKKEKRDYLEYSDLVEYNDLEEYMTKPILFKVYEVKKSGFKIKIDDKIIEVPVGKFVCIFTNNIMKIMTRKELQEIAIQI